MDRPLDGTMLADCPDDDLIDRFIRGTATDSEQVQVRGHLPPCDACRRLVSELAKETLPIVAPGNDGDDADTLLLRGTELGRFVILELIGAGAMGMVYSAYDPVLDRKVALKLLHPDARADDVSMLRARLLREAQAMARVVHPNVVAIHEVGESGNLVYIAMELVPGRSVRALLSAREKPRRWREVLDLYVQAGRGLAAAHRAGIIHRDFKPDNVLVADDGRVVVSDFGLASVDGTAPAAAPPRRASSHSSPLLTVAGTVMGTPAYMAPEQFGGSAADTRADVYAFAASVTEGVRGQKLPKRVQRALHAAMRKDPAQRPDLEALLAVLSARSAQRVRRLATLAVAVVSTVLLAIAVRAVVVARAEAARAREHAEAARRLGEEVTRMELGLRVQRLLPLHDTGPAEEAVRGRLAEMRASLAGTPADAAVHDALGRGLAALGDHRAARADLERALELGSDDPQLHFVLGHTLLRLHDAALEDARRMGGSSFVAARKAALGAEYLPLARHHLDRSRGARIASPRYLEALLAYQSGDLERSLREAREAAREEPAFYEAHALAARVLEEQGQAAADRGDAVAADAAFLEAIAELETGARFGRSDAALYDALVEIWSRRLDLGQHEPDAGWRLAQLAGALLASDRLLAAAPRRTGAYGRRAHIFFLGQTGQTGNDAILAPLVERCTQAARTALELDPADVFALQMRGDCTMDRALALDLPLPALAGSVADFTEVLRLAPGSPWAANDLCLALTSFAELTWIAGRDAIPTAERAVANCLLATRLDPAYANPWLNITFTYGVLAAAASEGGPWDAASAAKAREAARRSYGMHPAGPVVSRVNLLALATFELEHARASGADPSAALRQVQDAIADLEAVTPVEWLRQGEIALVLLEARAAVAMASGDDAAPPIRRCLELDPVRFACRMLAFRAAPTVATAHRLVTDWPLSARTWVALADAHLRLGHRADAVAAAVTATALAPDFVAARAMLTRAASGTR